MDGVTTAAGPSPTIEVILDLEERTVDVDAGLADMLALAGVGT